MAENGPGHDLKHVAVGIADGRRGYAVVGACNAVDFLPANGMNMVIIRAVLNDVQKIGKGMAALGLPVQGWASGCA